MRSNAVLLILSFAVYQFSSGEDACGLETRMSTDMQAIVDGGKHVLSGASPSDSEAFGFGALATVKVGFEIAQSVPVVGSLFTGILGVVNRLSPSTPSRELQCMKQEFTKLHKKLDKISNAIKDLSKQIDQLTNVVEVQNLYQDYNSIRDHTVQTSLIDFLDDPFTKSRKSTLKRDCQNHHPYSMGLLKIAALISNSKRVGKPFLTAIIEATNGDRKQYLSLKNLVLNDVKEMSFLDGVCEIIVNPTSSKNARKSIYARSATQNEIRVGLINGEYNRQVYLLKKMLSNNLTLLNAYNFGYIREDYDAVEYFNRSGYLHGPKVTTFLRHEVPLIIWERIDARPKDGVISNRVEEIAVNCPVYHNLSVVYNFEQMKRPEFGACLKYKQEEFLVNNIVIVLSYFEMTNVVAATDLLSEYFKDYKSYRFDVPWLEIRGMQACGGKML